MKKCSVCETEIRSDLEEFGDPREPVCARCWLEGKKPEGLPIKIQAYVDCLRNQISEFEERIIELKNFLDDCWNEERAELEGEIYQCHLEIHVRKEEIKKLVSIFNKSVIGSCLFEMV